MVLNTNLIRLMNKYLDNWENPIINKPDPYTYIHIHKNKRGLRFNINKQHMKKGFLKSVLI